MPLRRQEHVSNISNIFLGNSALLRIISGKLKGRKLQTLKGLTTRPTLEKTRETIFNILQSHYDLSSFEAVDLFAGSGALGFESYSRGVKNVTFIEIDRSCQKLLKSNVEHLLLAKYCSIIMIDAKRWLKRVQWIGDPQLFLLDPPYQSDLAQAVVDILACDTRIPALSIIVLETEKEKEMIYPKHFQLFRKKVIGKTRIDFIEIQKLNK